MNGIIACMRACLPACLPAYELAYLRVRVRAYACVCVRMCAYVCVCACACACGGDRHMGWVEGTGGLYLFWIALPRRRAAVDQAPAVGRLSLLSKALATLARKGVLVARPDSSAADSGRKLWPPPPPLHCRWLGRVCSG